MTTPAVREPGAVEGRIVSPSAVANATQSSDYALGQVLKELVNGTPQAFSNENSVLAAHATIDQYIKSHVPAGATNALADGTQRAPIEDVTKRPAPAGTAYMIPQNTPAIDYDRLAAAIVRAQMAEQAAAPQEPTSPPAPAPVQQTEVQPQYGQ